MSDLLIGIIVLLALLLSVWGTARRTGQWRHWLVWAQVLLAAAFYALLVPPRMNVRDDVLTVLTPGASAEQLRHLPRAQRAVALPDAPKLQRATAVPDLASALRSFPDVSSVSIVGAGL